MDCADPATSSDPFGDPEATLARVHAALGSTEHPSEREQVELLDRLDAPNRNALLHVVTLMRDEGPLSVERISDIARRHRADGWAVLCGLGFIPPWGKLPPQQRIALQLAGALFADCA